MSALPNPFDNSEPAAAVPYAAETPAAAAPTIAAAGSLDRTDDIHEIFYHARKLVDDDHRFVLDVPAFMEALEEPPLFLRSGFMR